MSDLDILDAIDRATGCHQCEGPLGDSVSDLFCSQDCQEDWHHGRAVPLVGYREPFDIPAHYSNQPGHHEHYEFTRWNPSERFRVHALRLVEEARELHYTATTPGEPSAFIQWLRGEYATQAAFGAAALGAALAGTGWSVQVIEAEWAARAAAGPVHAGRGMDADLVIWDEVHSFGISDIARIFDVPVDVLDPGPVDPRTRALDLRRNRNTGPIRRQRPPRTLGPLGSSGRRW